MKVVQGVLGMKLRNEVKMSNTQFWFMKGKSTKNALYIVRQMQEKK